MSDTRAGMVKVEALRLVQEAGDAPQLVAAGDIWVAQDEIRTIAAETEPLPCSRIELKSGAVIRTAAAIEAAGGLLESLETAEATAATARFQPLVNQLQERTPEP